MVVAALAGCGQDDPGRPAASDAPAGGALVWAIGDLDAREPLARDVVGIIERSEPDRVVYLGDVYEDGTLRDFRANFDSAYAPLAALTWPTPGNHEWKRSAQGYFPYWTKAGGRPVEPWYRAAIAGWEIISLNSEAAMGPGSPQHTWLQQVLAGARGNCRIVFWHRPRYTAGTGHGDQADVAPLWELIAGRARIALAGHEHSLQRLAPIDGVVSFVSGAGGRHRYGIDQADPRLAFGDADVFGALRLELQPGRADHQFVALDGRVLDSGRVDCEAG